MIKPKFSLMRNGFAVVVDEKRYSKLRNYKENSKGEKSMLAYKAFNKNLTGHGGFQFEIGKTYETKEANQRQNGFHCAENPLDCFYYYGLNDRFCEVEAEGDIDDGDASVVVATKMTITREITLRGMVEGFIEYMMNFPHQEWTRSFCNIRVDKDKAEVKGKGIAVARGISPMVRGGKGSILALVQEDENGMICGAWIETVDGEKIKPDKWYTVSE